jgi:hypothetical protein
VPDHYERFDETPTDTRRWFNREEQAWVVQLVNAAGYQIGEATYIGVGGGGRAIAERIEHDLRTKHGLD